MIKSLNEILFQSALEYCQWSHFPFSNNVSKFYNYVSICHIKVSRFHIKVSICTYVCMLEHARKAADHKLDG